MVNNQFVKDTVNKALESGENYSDVLVLYGSMNQEVVNASLRIIENKLEGLKFPKTLISRSKLIGVEIMENIHKHQSRSSTMSPYFQVVLNNGSLCMSSGNSVSLDNYSVLNEKLTSYEGMTLDELKELYLGKLSNEEISESGNAGLGLITILNRSNKGAKHELIKVSESEYFFKLEVNLNNTVVVR
ncbi:MAG: hypothetical protein IT236_02890 [Bacteroidia bacterium]|nr:hypothetical protein [Bacteroidia bacterium]